MRRHILVHILLLFGFGVPSLLPKRLRTTYSFKKLVPPIEIDQDDDKTSAVGRPCHTCLFFRQSRQMHPLWRHGKPRICGTLSIQHVPVRTRWILPSTPKTVVSAVNFFPSMYNSKSKSKCRMSFCSPSSSVSSLASF
jgi:hypothetical protein